MERCNEIESFGFKILRLMQAQENCEFLLVNTDNNKYYQFSMKRGREVLKLMIEKILNCELIMYMKKQELISRDAKSAEAMFLFNQWINKEIIIIDNLNYKPTLEEIYTEGENKYYNIYKRSLLLKEELKTDLKEFPFIKKLLLNIVSNDEKGYLYLIKWLAWQIQNPQKRLATSIVLQGEQGSGKTLLCNYVFKPIFEKNFIEISQSDVQGEYGEYLMGKQLIVANEVLYNERKVNASEKLKNFVSDDFVNIKRKYKDSLYMQNYAHWIFTSNNQIPIKIEKGDRRFSVFKSKKLKDGVNFFLEFEKNINEELKVFVKYLKTIEVELKEVNYPYMNIAKKDIIEASLNSVELFLETAKEQGGLDVINKELDEYNETNSLLYFITKKQFTYIKLDSLYKLYQRFCNYNGIKNQYGRNGFTSQLKHLNYNVSIIKDDFEKSHRVMKLMEDLKE